jgi:hypothetical protein
MDFAIASFARQYNMVGDRRIDAVVQLKAAGQAAGGGAELALGLVIDNSGSMKGGKLARAKDAAQKAIAKAPDGAWLFVATFSETARLVVPAHRVSDETRTKAMNQVNTIIGDGGTLMSTGLRMAREQFAACPTNNCHAGFWSDGENNNDVSAEAAKLAHEIESCRGLFQCHSRGIGDKWRPQDLIQIAEALNGTAAMIANPDDMAADFIKLVADAASKQASGARLLVRTPKTATLVAVRQVHPENADLTPSARRVDERTSEFPVGAWADGEEREYQVTVEIDPGEAGGQSMAFRPSVAWTERGAAKSSDGPPVTVSWTLDDALALADDPTVAHYAGQQELTTAIRQGLDAKRRGDAAEATVRLGRAVQIAHASGNADATERLKRLVDIEDPGTGTVRLRRASRADELEADVGAGRTTKARGVKQEAAS